MAQVRLLKDKRKEVFFVLVEAQDQAMTVSESPNASA